MEVGAGCEIFNNINNTVGNGTYSHAEGYMTLALGNNAHAEGNSTSAINSGTHAEGYMTHASGTQAHAEGSSTLASGSQSHAEGYKTCASSSYSHSEGYQTSTNSNATHIEGHNNTDTASTPSSSYGNHIEGYLNIISGNNVGCHVEGCGNNYTGGGEGNHIEGYLNNVTGTSARYGVHVGGIKSNSAKNFSFIHGCYCQLGNTGGLNGLAVVGQFNRYNFGSTDPDKNALFIVGNGEYTGTETSLTKYSESDIDRRNALVVCLDRTNSYVDTYTRSCNFIAHRVSGLADGYSTSNTGSNRGFYIKPGDSDLVGLYTGGSNCYVGSSSAPFYAAYVTNIYGTVKGSADYAEYMEWSDGNLDNDDRRGLLVAYDITDIDGDDELKIRPANKDDDIIGIISSAPVVLGDAYDDHWHDKYQKDIFGSIIYDKIEHEDADENDKIEYRPRLSEDYDENKKYIYLGKIDLNGLLLVC